MSSSGVGSVRSVSRGVGWAVVAGLVLGARAFAAAPHSRAPSVQGATEWAVAPFVVELVGPLQNVRFEGDLDAPGSMGLPAFVVELEVSLAAGERRRFVAPTLVADPRGVALGGARAPKLVATDPAGAEGQVKVVAGAVPRAAGSDASARGARLLPPADDAPRRAPGLALVCLAVALPVVLARGAFGIGALGNGARRLGRTLFAVVVTLVVAGGAVAIDARQGWARGANSAEWTSGGLRSAATLRAPRSALWLGDDGRVVRIDAWTRTASIRAPSFEGDESGAGLGEPGCVVSLDLSGVAARGAAPVQLRYSDERGTGVWMLVAERGTWLVEREFSSGARLLRPEVNTWGACAEVWVREANGAWGRRGAWELGGALPELAADGAGSAPPGWLAAGLPQGVRVLVARLAPGTWAGPSAAAGAALRVGPKGGPSGADGPITADGPVTAGGELWLRRADF